MFYKIIKPFQIQIEQLVNHDKLIAIQIGDFERLKTKKTLRSASLHVLTS